MMYNSQDLDTALEEMNHAKDSFFHNHQQRQELLDKIIKEKHEQMRRNEEEIRKNSEKLDAMMAEMKAIHEKYRNWSIKNT